MSSKVIRVIQYLDADFVKVKAADLERPDDLTLVSTVKGGVVLLKFSDSIVDLPLLPGEARQMAETLNQLADLLDPPDEE